MPSFFDLGDEIAVAVKGQVHAEIYAVYLAGLGDAYLRIDISDINNIIQGKPGAVAFIWEVSFFEMPSILDVLLYDPSGIVDAIDRLFQPLSDMTLGRKGAITEFPVPFVGSAVGKSMNAGKSDNILEKFRRTVIGALEDFLDKYDVNDGESTVADLIAILLTDLLGDTLGILSNDVTVTYYEHNGTSLIPYSNYTDEREIGSLMFEIPLGQTFTFELPPLNFDLDNEAFPLELKTRSTERPALTVEWSIKLAFGFDRDDGFFLYTYRK